MLELLFVSNITSTSNLLITELSCISYFIVIIKFNSSFFTLILSHNTFYLILSLVLLVNLYFDFIPALFHFKLNYVVSNYT